MDETAKTAPEGAEEVVVDVEAIGERYEEKGYFKRLADMSSGLKQAHDTREYKEAKTELQRLSAPLIAFISVLLFVVVLIVVTALDIGKDDGYVVKVVPPEEEPPQIEDVPEEPDDPPEIPLDQQVDPTAPFTPDAPPPASDIPMPPSPNPGGEPNTVSPTPSPVTMKNVRLGKIRGMGDGMGGFGSKIGGDGTGGGVPEGALIGEIVDFKRDSKGESRGSKASGNDYWQRANEFIQGRFSESSCPEGYRLPMRVALSHLWIPEQDANNGPKDFGAERHMEPKYWMAHYTGNLAPVKNMRCRFIGYFDDLMTVLIDGKPVLDVQWAMRGNDKALATGWKSPVPAECKWSGPQPGSTLIVGDWIDFRDGRPVKIDLLIGERPGGKIGGLLLIEEEGVQYEKMPNGRPKWPIFTTIPLSERQKQEFEAVPWGIGIDYPRFNYRPKKVDITDGDIQVDSGI